MNLTYTIILAVLLDQWLGEPKKYHPLVFFGRWADCIERLLRRPTYTATQLKYCGVLALFVLVVPLTATVYLLAQWGAFKPIMGVVILYFCIAAKSLKQHANAVFLALDANDLVLARQKLALIVSRQTQQMNADEVRRATIESVLENGSDAVFAPLFWFIVAGPAGVILYRLSNTLDAMWGYKHQSYLHFGWAAARFDDLLNSVPARLVAISYALLGHRALAFKCCRQHAHLLSSPNAGLVMAAGAGALNLQLGGPAWYHDQRQHKIFFGGSKVPRNPDIQRANGLITRTVLLWIFASMVVQTVGAYLA